MIEFGAVRGRTVPQGSDRSSARPKVPACRDLVAIGPAEPRASVRPATGARSSATFLAHLIATAQGHAQTREKRRLAPEDASRLYAAAQMRKNSSCSRLRSL